MNKIKDIFYNINDIIVVMIIVAAAALLIYTRIDAIVSYPEVLAKQAALEVHEQDYSDTGNGSAEGNGGEDNSGAAANDEKSGEDSDGTNTEIMSVYINTGSNATQIATILVDAGLVDSVQEFLDALNAVNGASRLKAGEFMVPVNATTEEVVQIMTGNPQ